MMWSEILGHETQIARLKKDLEENRLPHALLFCGIEGIGKKKIALALAQAINNTTKVFHPDCVLIEPAGKTIRIEVLRELKQKAYLHPLEGKAKVFIIDDADKMTTAGANALLKILEEPPQETYFILVTSRPSFILTTIRSRCRMVSFSPLVKEKLPKNPQEEESKKEALAGWNQLGPSPAPSQIFKLGEAWSDEEEKLPAIIQSLGEIFYEKINQTEEPARLKMLTDRWLAIQKAKNKLETYANKRLLVESLLFRLSS